MIQMQYSHFTDLMHVNSVTLQHTLYLERKGNRKLWPNFILALSNNGNWRDVSWGANSGLRGFLREAQSRGTAWSGL